MILLDTHVLVWLALDTARIGAAAATVIAQRERAVSTMTWWEIAMFASRGRVAINGPVATWIDRAVYNVDARKIDVTSDIAVSAGAMPRMIHGDPCDRILMATAWALGCPLVTADEKIIAYAAAGHVEVIDARA